MRLPQWLSAALLACSCASNGPVEVEPPTTSLFGSYYQERPSGRVYITFTGDSHPESGDKTYTLQDTDEDGSAVRTVDGTYKITETTFGMSIQGTVISATTDREVTEYYTVWNVPLVIEHFGILIGDDQWRKLL